MKLFFFFFLERAQNRSTQSHTQRNLYIAVPFLHVSAANKKTRTSRLYPECVPEQNIFFPVVLGTLEQPIVTPFDSVTYACGWPIEILTHRTSQRDRELVHRKSTTCRIHTRTTKLCLREQQSRNRVRNVDDGNAVLNRARLNTNGHAKQSGHLNILCNYLIIKPSNWSDCRNIFVTPLTGLWGESYFSSFFIIMPFERLFMIYYFRFP